MKTGYTEAAGRTLVSCAERDGQTLICVTLNDRNDWEDHSALFDFGFQNWNPRLLARAGKTVRTLPVRGSLLPQASVATATDVVYPLYYTERVNASITLPAMVIAPVKKGDIAGKITFQVEENVVGETYLLYTEDVPATAFRPSLIQQIRELLHGKEGEALSFAAFWLNMEGNT